jgi:ribosomal protein S27E
MADERVSCPKCSKKSVPRLWHRAAIFTKMKTDHLCPYCGVAMYTTGGGLSIISKLFLFFVAISMLGSLLLVTMEPAKMYQISEGDLRFSKEQVEKYNIEIHALEESIKKESTPYLVERAQGFREQRNKFQMNIDEFYKERQFDSKKKL